MLTKYGYDTISVIAIISFVLIAVSLFANNSYIKLGLWIISAVMMLFTIYFFRDPDRITPEKENVVVSPADGKVLLVRNVKEDRFLNEDAWQISIFMSPFDVHVNRIPIDGEIEYLKYHKGEYLVAYHDKADERNERNEIGIKSEYGKVLFTQVAGFVARRIVCNLDKGNVVKKGDRFGMIKFGSRVDVMVNSEWKPTVKEGDRVTAGESILFEFNR